MYKPVIFSAVVGFIGVEIARKMFIKHFKPMRCKECYSPISRINCSPQFFYTWNFFNASIMLLFISFFLINNSKNSFTNIGSVALLSHFHKVFALYSHI